MLFVTNQTRTERLKTCEGCKYYKADTKSCGELLRPRKLRNGVKLCGCYMPVKARLKVASCPAGYWEAKVTPETLDEIRAVLNYSGNLEPEQVQKLTDLYNEVVGANAKPTSCSSCLRLMLDELKEFLDMDAEKEIDVATQEAAARLLVAPPVKKEKKQAAKETSKAK